MPRECLSRITQGRGILQLTRESNNYRVVLYSRCSHLRLQHRRKIPKSPSAVQINKQIQPLRHEPLRSTREIRPCLSFLLNNSYACPSPLTASLIIYQHFILHTALHSHPVSSLATRLDQSTQHV
jgi:hypothetical protein